METELLAIQIADTADEMVALEAYLRGLIDSFTIGVMAGGGFLSLEKYEHLNMSAKNKTVYIDGLARAKNAVAHDSRVASALRNVYGNVGLKWSEAAFPTRLDSSAMTNEKCFQIGVDDGLYQVSIAGAGMFQPTRALQGWWDRNDQG